MMRTGDAAKFFDVRRDTLLYYDRIGLLSPVKDPNGYRAYTQKDLSTLDMILSLRSVDVSIGEIRDYFRNPSITKLKAISEREIEAIEMRIARLRKTQLVFERFLSISKELSDVEFGRLYLREYSDTFLLCSSPSGDGSLADENWYNVFSSFIKEQKGELFMHIGSMISYGEGPALDRLYIESPERKGEKREGGLFHVWYHQGPIRTLERAYRMMSEAIQEAGYKAPDLFYEDYLITDLCEEDENRHVTRLSVRAESLKQGEEC